MLAFASDGPLLASVITGHVELWNPQTHSSVSEIVEGVGFPASLGLSSKLLVIGDKHGRVRVWDASLRKQVATIEAHASFVNALTFSRDGQTLVTGGGDQLIHFWDVTAWQKKFSLKGHLHQVWAVAFSRDETLLASASKDGTVKLWSTTPPKQSAATKGLGHPLGFSSDGEHWITVDTNQILRYWSVPDVQLIRSERAPVEAMSVDAMRLCLDGRVLAVRTRDSRLELWSLESRKQIAVLPVDDAMVENISISRDGRWLALGRLAIDSQQWRRWAEVWDLAAQSSIARFDDAFGSIAISPDGTKLAAAILPQAAKLWDVSSKRLVAVLEEHQNSVTDVKFSPDGRWLTTASDDGTVRLWHPRTGALKGRLQGHMSALSAVIFSPDSKTLVAHSTDGTIWFWCVANQQELMTLGRFYTPF